MTDIAKESLEIGIFPKVTWIFPNHKSESKLKPINYRPLALTAHTVKIIER